MKKYLVLSIILAGILTAVAFPLRIIAQSNNSQDKTTLSVTPPTFDLSANPGDTVKNSIKVQNVTDKPLSIKTAIKNFEPVGTQGDVGLTDDSGQYSLASWIHVTPGSSVLQPKESKVFNFSIDIPKNAEPGGKFGSIVFQTAPGSDKTAVGVSQQIGTLLLLRIAGDAKESAHIVSMQADRDAEGQSVIYKTLIANDGNVQVKPIGSITVTNMFGKKITTMPFGGKYVIPGAQREFDNTWNHKGVLFGKYTATLTLLYGTKNTTLTATTSFISIPWKLISIILLAIVLLGFVLWKSRKRLKRAFLILFEKD